MTEALSSLKYAVFFLVFFLGIPAGYTLVKKHPAAEQAVFFLLLFFTCRMEDINFVSRETYRLTTKGFEIGMVDILTLILLLTVLNRKTRLRFLVPGTGLFLAYFIFSLLSVVNAASPLFSFFEIFKMVRMLVFFLVVYHYMDSAGKFHRLARNITLIIIFIFFTVMKEKYVDGSFQAQGPFPHQNSLVMYMIVFTSVVFARLLNARTGAVWYDLTVFGMGGIVILSTLSRAGMFCFALSCLVILALSFGSGFNAKKLAVSGLLLLLGAAVLLKSIDSITERFATAPEESSEVRVLLARAAVKMANDKLLGVGLNNFGVKINPPYPYGDHIEHKRKDDEDIANGLVETVYLMIAAETGWHNLFVFILLLLTMFGRNLHNLFRYRNTPLHFIPVGLTGGLAGIYLESSLEWVLKQTNNFYQLMLAFAVIGSMYARNLHQDAGGSQ